MNEDFDPLEELLKWDSMPAEEKAQIQAEWDAKLERAGIELQRKKKEQHARWEAEHGQWVPKVRFGQITRL